MSNMNNNYNQIIVYIFSKLNKFFQISIKLGLGGGIPVQGILSNLTLQSDYF